MVRKAMLIYHLFKNQIFGGRQCLTSVILATEEPEMRRMAVQGQPRKQ
jgi:hypothetical protein